MRRVAANLQHLSANIATSLLRHLYYYILAHRGRRNAPRLRAVAENPGLALRLALYVIVV